MMSPDMGGVGPTGYILHDGLLTIATGEDVLRTTVRLQNGQGRSLAETSIFEEAARHLPESRSLTLYVDLQRLVEELTDAGSTLPEEVTPILVEAAGALIVSSGYEGGYGRGTLVLTLFPEGPE